MSKSYNAMRSSIIESSALIEALIDFGEDEGIPVEVFERGICHFRFQFPFVPVHLFVLFFAQATDILYIAQRQIITLQELVRKQLDDGRRGEIIRNGIRLAIVGAPNAGKSSLLNWLGTCLFVLYSSRTVNNFRPYSCRFPVPNVQVRLQTLFP